MKKTKIFLLLCMASIFNLYADDYSEMAYMEATDNNGNAIELRTASVKAEVNIVGVIADVVTTQTFINPTSDTLNADYVFPGSTSAAVYGMEMQIGDRIIKAEIKEREEAKETFNKAKEEGKTASLLQQHRPNVFQTSVGNLLPNQEIKVILHYTELIKPTEGVYEFVYPTTVGERYTSESNGEEEWTTAPGIVPLEGTPKLPSIDINIHLNAPVALHGVNITTHTAITNFLSKKKAEITYSSNNRSNSNKSDFILRYKLKGERIETGLTLYEGEDENFFLYMGQSPKRVTPEIIPPREYFFIVDVSGSMSGQPLTISKNMMDKLLSGLKPTDKFNIMLFASSSSTFAKNAVAATPENISEGLEFIDSNSNVGGGTNMLSALKHAFKMSDPSSSTSMVILTDGYISVEKEAFEFIRDKLGEANFFSFGIGNSVNRYLIEGLAHIGHSEPFIITDYSQAERKSALFRKYVSSPVLTNIQVEFKDFDAYDLTPVNTPDLMAEKPVIVFGKWKGEPKGDIILSGVNGEGSYKSITKVSKKLIEKNNVALKYLWARNKIKTLSNYEKIGRDSELKSEITALGLKYSLLTDYTSFVAIDEQEQTEETHNNHTPPSGGVPEPHEWALIIFILSVTLWYSYGQLSRKKDIV